MRSALVLTMLATVGCVSFPGDEATVAGAPLIGVDGTRDTADRSCHVVLRDLARVPASPGWQTDNGSWIWEGTIELSDAAAGEGAVPALLYHYGSDPTWYQVDATPSGDAATAGFERYRIRIASHLPGPGMSGTAITSARIEVIALAQLAEGGRLFDHNRVPGDLDTHVLAYPSGFAIAAAPAICVGSEPDAAHLVFADDFTETVVGALRPGGTVILDYDADRLTTCRNSQGGMQRWDISAHVRWNPSGALVGSSVTGMNTGGRPATFVIPAGTTSMDVWFENTSVSGCRAWDSNDGANYRFELPRAPAWIGNPVARISRDTSDTCAGGSALDGFVFDTWGRQRAAITNLCFQVWEPGVTDRDDPELWRKLDVQVHWRGAGTTAWRHAYVPFDRRVGNDARYAFNLRQIDPFASYTCPYMPIAPTENGQYVRGDAELYFTVNGAELRPGGPGSLFVGHFDDYPSNPFRDANCVPL